MIEEKGGAERGQKQIDPVWKMRLFCSLWEVGSFYSPVVYGVLDLLRCLLEWIGRSEKGYFFIDTRVNFLCCFRSFALFPE